jgi:serine/threonine-protein kinase
VSRRRLVSRLASTGVLGLTAFLSVAVMANPAAAYKVPKPKQCRVPSVIGKHLDHAERKIVKAHCLVGSVTGPANGIVISQDPAPGSAGPTVNLVLGSKPKHCTVPAVIGLRLSGAVRSILKAHCEVGKVTTQRSLVPIGRVVSQSPPPGSAGPSISLVISSGISHGARCRVPNVLGKRLARAKLKLRRAGCAVGRVIRRPSRRHRGRVIGERPRPGRIEPVGKRVRLIVSAGRRGSHRR